MATHGKNNRSLPMPGGEPVLQEGMCVLVSVFGPMNAPGLRTGDRQNPLLLLWNAVEMPEFVPPARTSHTGGRRFESCTAHHS